MIFTCRLWISDKLSFPVLVNFGYTPVSTENMLSYFLFSVGVYALHCYQIKYLLCKCCYGS